MQVDRGFFSHADAARGTGLRYRPSPTRAMNAVEGAMYKATKRPDAEWISSSANLPCAEKLDSRPEMAAPLPQHID